MTANEWRYEVFADFHQFLVRDESADWTSLAGAWSDPRVTEHQFFEGGDYVAIGTARDGLVPVTVRLLAEPAQELPREAQRISDGVLRVAAGAVQVMGITDNGLSGGRIPVPPGQYRIRVISRALDSVSANGLEGFDNYEVLLWRVPAS